MPIHDLIDRAWFGRMAPNKAERVNIKKTIRAMAELWEIDSDQMQALVREAYAEKVESCP